MSDTQFFVFLRKKKNQKIQNKR